MKSRNAGRASSPQKGADVVAVSPLQLLHRLMQISVDIYNDEVGDMAITQRQFAVLQSLSVTDGISQSQLCQVSGIDRSTLADLVARMARKGLVRRERSPADRRISLVWLTVAGRVALHSLLPQVRAANEKIRRLMSEPDCAALAAWLSAAADDVVEEAQQPEPPASKAEEKAPKPKNGKSAKALSKLPMPPLSKGAVADAPADAGETDKAGKWKSPKPIWNV